MGATGRPAGFLEKFYIARDKLQLDTCVVVTAIYKGPNTLAPSSLFPALETVLTHHRALSTQVHHGTGTAPILSPLPTVDLPRLVTYHAEGVELQSIAISILLSRIQVGTTDPLWRLHVFQDGTVAFAYNHLIGDGKSGVAFHRALLTALNQTRPLNHVTVVSIPGDITLVPSLEDVMDISVSYTKFAGVIYNMLAPTSWTSLSSAYTGNPIDTKQTLDIGLRFLALSEQDATRLLAITRRHSSTLTSFLHTVGVAVLSELISSLPDNRFTTIATSVPISLRSFAGTSEFAFCNHFGGYGSFVDILQPVNGRLRPQDFPWDAASQFAVTLRQNAKSSREQVGLLKYLSDPYEDFFLGQQGKKRAETMELSNLGRFPSDKDAPTKESSWTIGDMFFMQSNAVCGAALKIMVVGSPAGSLGITFNWTKGAVEDAFAEAFVLGFGDLMKGILDLDAA